MKTMRKLFIALLALFILSCMEKTDNPLSAQAIVDKAIAVCGGDLYKTMDISFKFRDRRYRSENRGNQKILKRILKNDTITILDVKEPMGFKRYINDSLVQLPDSLSNAYSNSVNSVHYLAYLPYGLNDLAANKELLGEVSIKGVDYYKIKVTFNQNGGGDDFEDVFVYWFNKKTFKPDYLAYEFHVNEGGMRFREAFNERYINGIRFVDYNNYSPLEDSPILGADSLYINRKLKLLSKIELEEIEATIP